MEKDSLQQALLEARREVDRLRSILGHLEKYQQIYGINEPIQVMIPLNLSY